MTTFQKRFDTVTEPFTADYVSRSQLQAQINAAIIEGLSEDVACKRPAETVDILDLCCGDGRPTYLLVKKIEEKGLRIGKVVGYDISRELITQAKQCYEHDHRFHFRLQNVESFSDEKQYDLVVSFFGFHWINQLDKLSAAIANALKPGGKVMFLVPLDIMDLFELRQDFIQHSIWRSHFEGFTIKPFITDPAAYRSFFDAYFDCQESRTHQGIFAPNYTKSEFIAFLSGWTQELRHLEVLGGPSADYMNEFFDFIPLASREDNIIKTPGGVLYKQHYFYYQGYKKAAPCVTYFGEGL